MVQARTPLVAAEEPDQWWGTCPFCDSSSQLVVCESPSPFFYCTKCDSTGDALHFVTAFDKRPLSDVIADFAKQVGVELKDGDLADPEAIDCPFRRGLSQCDWCCLIRPNHTEPTQTPAATAEAGAVKPRVKQRRGFAAMDKDAHRELARSGGVAAHAAGMAHKFSSEQAREAGKKGGRTTSANREHMAEIGRRGGIGKRGHRKGQSPKPRQPKNTNGRQR
ncbi:MAG: hypothetical protein JNM40_21470 [Myxococcales bacterium]|nr:hypothetical protein [Myxococcales bacterium]